MKTALQKLGSRLADLLDEDQWAECEALLLEAGAETYEYQPMDIDDVESLLEKWNDPLEARTMPQAKELIYALQVEIAGRRAMINALKDDVEYYMSRFDLGA